MLTVYLRGFENRTCAGREERKRGGSYAAPMAEGCVRDVGHQMLGNKSLKMTNSSHEAGAAEMPQPNLTPSGDHFVPEGPGFTELGIAPRRRISMEDDG